MAEITPFTRKAKIISSYNSITGGEITATWDGEEAEVEILESDVD